MSDGVLMAMSACICCGQVFMFDPDRVPSVAVREGTGRGTSLPMETGEPGPGFTNEPICPVCAKRVNLVRAELGLPLIDETDTVLALVGDIGRDGP